MSFSVNRATLLGNMSKEPELRTTPSGMAVCSFGVATNNSIKNKQTGEWTDVPTFHNVVVWGKLAEWVSRDLHKGNKVYIEGRIENRSYQDKQGVTKYISEIIASEVIAMAGAKKQETETAQVVVPDDVELGTNFDSFDFDSVGTLD